MSALTIGSICRVTGLFTSESVADGHPDKICDQISDAILDDILRQDADGHAAIETGIKDNEVWVFGEVSANADVDPAFIVRQVLTDIGHGGGRWGLDLDKLEVRSSLRQQSPEIRHGVVGSSDLGAGDQGLMFGYATADTPERLPTPLAISHRLLLRLKELRVSNPDLGPDAKAQVSLRYEDGRPAGIEAIVLSSQHHPDLSLHRLRDLLRDDVIAPVLGEEATGAQLFLNPAGAFTQGGPIADAGLTGRKIIVDSYGGFARHGGGAFSGKDGTKVDRSGAYAARQLARAVVESGLSAECEVRLAYAIGHAAPVAIHVDVVDPGKFQAGPSAASEIIDLFRPARIIERLGLRAPIYRPTSSYGHFGRAEFAWERSTPMLDDLLSGISRGRL